MWEHQFGFPAPEADAKGERSYPRAQLQRLRLIAFLVHAGERPALLMALDTSALAELVENVRAAMESPPESADSHALRDCMKLIQSNSAADLDARMRSHIIAHGLPGFILHLAAPLCGAVGMAWESGQLSVFQEHIFSETLERTLLVASSSLFQPDALRHGRPKPAVLLATPPGEAHRLGLAMVEALMRVEGCHCMRLGCDAPVSDIVTAARVYRSDIVALSFSTTFPAESVKEVLAALRGSVDKETEVWAGGSNAALRRKMAPGITALDALEMVESAVARWRMTHGCMPSRQVAQAH